MNTNNILPFFLALTATPVALASATSLSGCATTQMTGEQNDDTRVKGRVGRQLAVDPQAKRARIDVDVLERVVTLRGTAPDQASKDAAERVAVQVEGVRRVDNQLVIDSRDAGPRMSTSLDDSGLKTKIGAKLAADPVIRRFNIDVDVENGVAYLSGIVADAEAKSEAEVLASSVDGVKSVRNELKVENG